MSASKVVAFQEPVITFVRGGGLTGWLSLVEPHPLVVKVFQRPGTRIVAAHEFCVDRSCRREGLGASLMTSMIEWADAQKVDIWLYVDPYAGKPMSVRQLAAFYRKYGFQRVARRSPDYEMLRRHGQHRNQD